MEHREKLSSCGIRYSLVHIFSEPVRDIHDRALTFSMKRKDKTFAHGFTELDVKLNARHIFEETKQLHIDTKQLIIDKGSRRDLGIQRLKVESVHYLNNGADININNSWMETSTIVANRKELAK